MSAGVQITLIICITFLLSNLILNNELKEIKKKRDPICPPKPKLPPVPTRNLEYKIFTKDDYKRYVLSTTEGINITKEYVMQIDELFAKISKGYNFIVGTGQGETLMFYGPEFFNKEVLGGKNK